MSLHNDLHSFLLSRTAVTNPITSYYSVAASDEKVRQRIAYHTGPRNVGDVPYLIFSGPFNYDAGIYSGGSTPLKVATWVLTCYTPKIDLSLDWITAIEKDFDSLFVFGYFADLASCRIMSITPMAGSKLLLASDQVLQTSKEVSTAAAVEMFQIGWQE